MACQRDSDSRTNRRPGQGQAQAIGKPESFCGIHRHTSGMYRSAYAAEMAWREDYRRVSNGDQTSCLAGLAMHKRTSADFVGYWQRHLA